jgi:hypothetical protein
VRVPIGEELYQRPTSFTTAWTKGSAGRSVIKGNRPLPTTASSSSRAFFCTAGWLANAKKRACATATVYKATRDPELTDPFQDGLEGSPCQHPLCAGWHQQLHRI